MINKYEYLTGRKLATYETIKEASIDNNMSYHTIYKMLQQKVLKYPRDDFYFGYDPKPRYIILAYDNESLDLLGYYKNIKDASVCTGVSPQQIQWQVSKGLPITQNRIKGSTTMFFKREKISY